jgi:hypothetical protein
LVGSWGLVLDAAFHLWAIPVQATIVDTVPSRAAARAIVKYVVNAKTYQRKSITAGVFQTGDHEIVRYFRGAEGDAREDAAFLFDISWLLSGTVTGRVALLQRRRRAV